MATPRPAPVGCTRCSLSRETYRNRSSSLTSWSPPVNGSIRPDRLMIKFKGTLDEALDRMDEWVIEQRREHIGARPAPTATACQKGDRRRVTAPSVRSIRSASKTRTISFSAPWASPPRAMASTRAVDHAPSASPPGRAPATQEYDVARAPESRGFGRDTVRRGRPKTAVWTGGDDSDEESSAYPSRSRPYAPQRKWPERRVSKAKGSYGAASDCTRLDPVTGEVIEVTSPGACRRPLSG